jgi:hypothetical protein
MEVSNMYEELRLFTNSDVIKLSGEAFIIPNNAIELGKNKINKESLVSLKKMIEFNNIDFDPNTDKLIYLQYLSDKAISNDFAELGFRYKGKWYEAYMTLVPAKIFEEKVEGDEMTLYFPCRLRSDQITYIIDPTKVDLEENIIEFTFKLNQLNYGYRSYGRFEECFKYVTK